MQLVSFVVRTFCSDVDTVYDLLQYLVVGIRPERRIGCSAVTRRIDWSMIALRGDLSEGVNDGSRDLESRDKIDGCLH